MKNLLSKLFSYLPIIKRRYVMKLSQLKIKVLKAWLVFLTITVGTKRQKAVFWHYTKLGYKPRLGHHEIVFKINMKDYKSFGI